LKQSSRKWYENLTTALATLGFTPLETDHAIFKFVQDDNITSLQSMLMTALSPAALHPSFLTCRITSPSYLKSPSWDLSADFSDSK
jgi:hypothetical protein